MLSKNFSLVLGLLVSVSSQKPHRGPKVSRSQLQQQFGQYVAQPAASNSKLNQILFQPEHVQYIQQALQPQYQPIQTFTPQQQYQPLQQSSFVHGVGPQQVQNYQSVEQDQLLQQSPVLLGAGPQHVKPQPIQYQGVQQDQIQKFQYVPVQGEKRAVEEEIAPEDATPIFKNLVKNSHGIKSEAVSNDADPQSQKYRAVPNEINAREYRSQARQISTTYPNAPANRGYDHRLVNSVLRNAPSGSMLIGARANDVQIPALRDRLISNYTEIRDDSLIVDNFRCDDKDYGYYADVDNDCQIFHICLPVHRLPYPEIKPTEAQPPTVTYTFSFICPAYTIFSQDVIVCAWEREAIPCSSAPQLYSHVNGKFFEAQKTEY